ncbi:MAG: MgtC/SapB family protein, partial [Gemmatimonadetes bacterium]|nr:MgtC/SapB family protein [Gemmatimonadota bacterium]
MTPLTSEFEAVARLAIAALVGIGVGLEREWSGHAAGPHARFAGLRTFLLLGLLGGIAGLLIAIDAPTAGAVLAGAAMTFGVVAYAMAVRQPDADLDGTTEAAALAVVAIGTLAGVGYLGLAAGIGSLVVLALSEKTRLHWLVQKVGETELRAALQFSVLALVVLPLLPEGPILSPLDVRPRALWTIVLVFSGINFAGFLARRAVGAERGYPVVGMVGGIISSTLVTFDFSRRSRHNPAHSAALATGVIGACTVL